MDAPTLVEVVSSVCEVVVALAALTFALLLARHESKCRQRIEERLETLRRAVEVLNQRKE